MTQKNAFCPKNSVMRTPRSVDVEITSMCNLRCRYCYYFDNLSVTYQDLSTNEWLKFFDELGRCAVMDVTLQGASPLQRQSAGQRHTGERSGVYATLSGSRTDALRRRRDADRSPALSAGRVSGQQCPRKAGYEAAAAGVHRSGDCKAGRRRGKFRIQVLLTRNEFAAIIRFNRSRFGGIIDALSP